MRRSRYWLLVLLLFVLLGAAAYYALRSRLDAGKGLPEYSVFSDEENGLATAAQVLRGMGFRPVALTRPIQHTLHQGVLIMVEPQESSLFGTVPGLGETDAEGLLAWVAKGNTLVLFTRTANPIHQKLGVGLLPDATPADEEKKLYFAEAEEIGGLTEPVDDRTVPVHALGVEGKDLVQGGAGVPLWYVGEQPGAWLVPHGEGQVLLIADPSLWTHRGLVRRDNVLLLYNLARVTSPDGRVFFDEYHHGIRSGGGYWDYLRYRHLHWLVLQLLAVIGVAVWAVGVRLGPARATPPPAHDDAVDYASAVARIYQRAGVQHLVAHHLARDFFENLTRHLHLRRNATPGDILKACERRFGPEAARELGGLLAAAKEMRAGDPERLWHRRELLHWARVFDEFVKRRVDGERHERVTR
jgi:hypothetical protein